MGGDCLKGGSNCHPLNARLQYGNPEPGVLPFPFPLPPWFPKHKTTSSHTSTSATHRITSTLPSSSNGVLTSTISLKSSHSPSAAVPISTPTLKTSITSIVSRSSTSVPNVSSIRTSSSTVVVIPTSIPNTASIPTISSATRVPSTKPKISNSVPSPTPQSGSSIVTVVTSTSSSAERSSTTPGISSSPVSSTLVVPVQTISSAPVQPSDPVVPTQLSSIYLMSVTGLSSIITPTAEAASQQTQAIGIGINEAPAPGKINNAAAIAVGTILGLLLLISPFIFFLYRRHTRRQQHRRSIGGIEKDRMFRPWKRSEINLRRKTSSTTTLYPSEKRPRELSMPEPVFAPLRPNRSSSLYSGSILNGITQLSPYQDTSNSWSSDTSSSYPDRRSIQSQPLSDKASSYRSSGYIYSDDPFQTPVIDPNSRRPESVVSKMTEWEPPPEYKGKIRFGMGVQRRLTGSTIYRQDGMF